MTRQALGGSEEALRRAKTTCRCCAAACGMVITLDPADRVLKAEGDRDHPISRGYSCGKGRAIPEMHHSADRLLQPRVRGADCGWDECLASLGQDLGDVIARHGN